MLWPGSQASWYLITRITKRSEVLFNKQPSIRVDKMNNKATVRRLAVRFSSVIMSVVMALITTSAIADSVEDMCKKSSDICACAARQLKTEVGDDDYRLYEAIGSAYIANQTAGMSMGDAWDAAVKAESNQRGSGFSETLSKTNAIGKAHRKAMKACAE